MSFIHSQRMMMMMTEHDIIILFISDEQNPSAVFVKSDLQQEHLVSVEAGFHHTLKHEQDNCNFTPHSCDPLWIYLSQLKDKNLQFQVYFMQFRLFSEF